MLRRLSFLCCSVFAFACGPVVPGEDDDSISTDQGGLGGFAACSNFTTPKSCANHPKRCLWVTSVDPGPIAIGAPAGTIAVPPTEPGARKGECVSVKGSADGGGVVGVDAGTGQTDAGIVVIDCKPGTIPVTQIGGPDIQNYPEPGPICVAVDYKCSISGAVICSCLPASQGKCTLVKGTGCVCDNGIR